MDERLVNNWKKKKIEELKSSNQIKGVQAVVGVVSVVAGCATYGSLGCVLIGGGTGVALEGLTEIKENRKLISIIRRSR